jgi:hypothetical protein
MKKLYEKDECAPDAQSIFAWTHQNGINWSDAISIEIGDTMYEFFTANNAFYMTVLSCGKFEDIYQAESLEEWINEIKETTKLFLANR